MHPHFHNTGQASMPWSPTAYAHVGNPGHQIPMPALEITTSTIVDKSDSISELYKAKTRLAEVILQHEQFKNILENATVSPDGLTDASMTDLNNKKASVQASFDPKLLS
ncbi:hypothetical protein NQZ79_g3048 [Umbelopsis isabellina]|nr:hypothetical protein NQZ79_g3048 [Umbelopsis isabellina]